MALIGDHFLGEAQIECLRPRVTFMLCHLWKIQTVSGKALRFASHDKIVYFEGEEYIPLGPSASDMGQSEAGGSTDFEVAGFLSHSTIRAKDITAGLFDGASIEHKIIDWSRPWYWLRSHKWWIERITVEGDVFRAEVNGVSKWLEVPLGKFYERECDKTFGGAECTATPVLVSGATVEEVPSSSGQILGALSTHIAMRISSPNTGATRVDKWGQTTTQNSPDNLWVDGAVTCTQGSNQGVKRRIQLSEYSTDTTTDDRIDILLDRPFPFPIRPGDIMDISSGCDGQFATCKAVYGNQINFGGIHRMPSTEDQYAAAEQGVYTPDNEV